MLFRSNSDEYVKIYNNQTTSDVDSDYEDNESATRDLLGYYPPPCPRCGTTMKFNFMTNKFKCFSCGYVEDEDVVQQSVFEEYEDDFEEYDDVYSENFDNDIMPKCCKACGGPWPDCASGCKIIDDD